MKITKEVIDNYITKLELKIRDLEIDIKEFIDELTSSDLEEPQKANKKKKRRIENESNR